MTITLEVLGELVRQVQADMRTIRSEIRATRSEIDELKAEKPAIIRAVADLIRASEARMMDRMAAFEAHVDTRIDRREG